MKTYTINESQRAALIEFLGDLPWKHASQPIALLAQLPEAGEIEAEAAEKPKKNGNGKAAKK